MKLVDVLNGDIQENYAFGKKPRLNFQGQPVQAHTLGLSVIYTETEFKTLTLSLELDRIDEVRKFKPWLDNAKLSLDMLSEKLADPHTHFYLELSAKPELIRQYQSQLLPWTSHAQAFLIQADGHYPFSELDTHYQPTSFRIITVTPTVAEAQS